MGIDIVLGASGLEVRGEGYTKHVPNDVVDTVLAKVFAPTGILMPAVRWISQGGHAVIMERPPFITRCSYRPAQANMLGEDDAQHYNIPVPWQVYGIVFSEDFREIRLLYVYVRNSPIMDLESTLHMFPYPNVFNTAQACMGRVFAQNFANTPTHDLAAAVAQVLNTFWSADFNEDAGPNTWYAPWRAPTASLNAEFQQRLVSETVTPWKLLRYYSEIPLEQFLRFEFPISNNLSHTGDQVQHLLAVLQAAEPVGLSRAAELRAALRIVHNLGLNATPAASVGPAEELAQVSGPPLEF